MSNPLTVADALAAAARHPAQQAAEARSEAARARAPQAAQWPDPMLMGGVERAPMADGSGAEFVLTLQQNFPLSRILSLLGEVEQWRARASEAAQATLALDLARNVARAYGEAWVLHELRAVIQANADLAAGLTELVSSRTVQGLATPSELLRAQAAQVGAISAQAVWGERDRLARIVLAEAMGLEPEALLARSLAAPPPIDERPLTVDQIAAALQARPEGAESRARIGESIQAEEVARTRFLPDLTLQVGTMVDTMGRTAFVGMIGFSLPFDTAAREAGVAEAEAAGRAARADAEDTYLRIRRQLAESDSLLQAARIERDSLVFEVLPLAEAGLESARAGYVAGTDELSAVLDSLRSLFTLRLQRIVADGEVLSRWIERERAQGRIPWSASETP